MDTKNDMLLDLMYRGTTTIQEFNWDMMTTTPILQLISPEEIDYIRQIITSPKYSGNLKFRLNTINDIMHSRGFTKLAGGTNRVVYTHFLAPNAVFKVAIDSVGIKDNPAEYYNQRFLKPYCTKVFECSTCGTIASFERVERLTTFEEFYSIADDYYYLITRKILGKYIMEDIGIDYFMNIGIRKGNNKFCGPVLLDFPYLYELDGRKLICDAELDDGTKCYGEIDYDAGFNKLICTKCGRRFRAHELAKAPENRKILIRSKGAIKMKFDIMTVSGKVLKTIDTNEEREFLSRPVAKNNSNENSITKNGIVKIIKKIVVKEVPQVATTVEKNSAKASINDHHAAAETEQKKTSIKYINIDLKKKNNDIDDQIVYKDSDNKSKLSVNIIKKTVKSEVKNTTQNSVNNEARKTTEVTRNAIVKRVVALSAGITKDIGPDINTETSDNPSVQVNLTKVNSESSDKKNTNTIVKKTVKYLVFNKQNMSNTEVKKEEPKKVVEQPVTSDIVKTPSEIKDEENNIDIINDAAGEDFSDDDNNEDIKSAMISALYKAIDENNINLKEEQNKNIPSDNNNKKLEDDDPVETDEDFNSVEEESNPNNTPVDDIEDNSALDALSKSVSKPSVKDILKE